MKTVEWSKHYTVNILDVQRQLTLVAGGRVWSKISSKLLWLSLLLSRMKIQFENEGSRVVATLSTYLLNAQGPLSPF